jgi:hypothetical protein
MIASLSIDRTAMAKLLALAQHRNEPEAVLTQVVPSRFEDRLGNIRNVHGRDRFLYGHRAHARSQGRSRQCGVVGQVFAVQDLLIPRAKGAARHPAASRRRS